MDFFATVTFEEVALWDEMQEAARDYRNDVRNASTYKDLAEKYPLQRENWERKEAAALEHAERMKQKFETLQNEYRTKAK